jgi:predicted DNA-binding transcriptional regulator AlpA
MQMEPLLRIDEVAELTGVPKKTLYFWRSLRPRRVHPPPSSAAASSIARLT